MLFILLHSKVSLPKSVSLLFETLFFFEGNYAAVHILSSLGASNFTSALVGTFDSEKPNPNVIRFLIAKGGKVECDRRMDRSCMYFAAFYVNSAAFKQLISLGCEDYQRGLFGACSSHLYLHPPATKKTKTEKNMQMIEFFLKEGARVEVLDNKIRNHPLIYASTTHNLFGVEKLLENANSRKIKSLPLLASGSLLASVKTGNAKLEIVEKLLLNGASPDVKDNKSSALHYSIMNGNSELTHLLLEHKANPNILADEFLSFTYGSPLLLASFMQRKDLVDLLLKYGADIKAVDKENRSVSFHAARRGKTEFVDFILSKGCEDVEGALFSALLSKNTRVSVEHFFSQKLDLMEKRKGQTLAVLLLSHSPHFYERILGGFVGRVSELNKIMEEYCSKEERTEVIEKLYEMGANDSNGALLSFCASPSKQTSVLEFIISKGADVNYVNEKGENALYLSSLLGKIEFMKVLCEKGAKHFDSALLAACKSNSDPLVAQFLIENYGANPDSFDKSSGSNCLQYACANDNANLVEILIKKGAKNFAPALKQIIEDDNSSLLSNFIDGELDLSLIKDENVIFFYFFIKFHF